MDFIQQHKNILIAIIIVIILFIAYALIKSDGNSAEKEPVSSTKPLSASDSPLSRDIIALLVDLKAIKIKKDFFSDPALKSMQDYTTPVSDEPRGRTNPFAPISGAAAGAGKGR